MSETPVKRIIGLDILRSMAILLVVIVHSNFLIDNYFNGFPYVILPDGVDLFFVLSGFLIGGILIRVTEQAQTFNGLTAFNFLIRRWLRTLPNYFLFLLLNIILIYFGWIKGAINKYLITYFFFFQNFHKPYDFLFWESWSLSVEEWFYLLFPMLLLLVFKISKPRLGIKYSILISIFFILIVPFLYRLMHALAITADLELYYRKIVLCRLDTIGFGLLGAYFYHYHPLNWVKSKNVLFILGIVLLSIILSIDTSLFFQKTARFSVVGLAILFLIPKFESLKNETSLLKPFRFISKGSYSMYLIHMPLLQIMYRVAPLCNKETAVYTYIIFWIVLFILAGLVYKYYERPLMDLRDRITINTFRKKK